MHFEVSHGMVEAESYKVESKKETSSYPGLLGWRRSLNGRSFNEWNR